MKKRCIFSAVLVLFLLAAAIGPISVFAEETETPVLYTENFDAFADVSVAKSELEKYWYLESAFTLEEAGTGKALKLDWAAANRQMILEKVYAPQDYEVSLCVMGGSITQEGGFIFLRTNSAIAHSWPNTLYEADLCQTDGFTSGGVGVTGIFLKLHGPKLHIGVKTAEAVDDVYQKGIGNLRHIADLPQGKDFGLEYVNIKITDRDHVVSVYIEDVLAATITYSNPEGEYYTKAVIKNADGQIVKQTETARIAVENTMGLSVRGSYMNVDELTIRSLTGIAPVVLPAAALYDTDQPRGTHFQVGADTELAMKITVAPGKAMKSLTYKNMPTYTGLKTEVTFSVYQWNTDYTSSLQQAPVYRAVVYDHKDNQDRTFEFWNPLQAGTYLFVLSDGRKGVNNSGAEAGPPGVWRAEPSDRLGVTVFANGEEQSFAIYSSMVLLDGYPIAVDPTEPEPTEPNPPETATNPPETNVQTGDAQIFLAGAILLIPALTIAVAWVMRRKRIHA